jgi:glyoxylase-like metal-dependent hydrolase (beta-lactamase superfamily II)
MPLLKINTGFIRLRFDEMYRLKSPGRWQEYPHFSAEEMVSLSMRSVFFSSGEHKIIIDPGPGTYIADDFPDYDFHKLVDVRLALREGGINPNDITDIFLTHLHFDHCGGIFHKEGQVLVPSFPLARIHYSRRQAGAVLDPDEFGRDSFLPDWENLVASRNVVLYEKGEKPDFLTDVFMSDGHTDGMMIPVFESAGQEYAFLSDLIPTALNEDPEVVSMFDRDPALLAREKMIFFEKIKERSPGFVYFHD